MEEIQIQEFVQRVIADEALRQELLKEPEAVIAREQYSPRLAAILLRLTPHLAFENAAESGDSWWHP